MMLQDMGNHEHFIQGKKFKIVIITVLMSILGYFLFTLWGGWQNVLQAFRQLGWFGIAVALGLSLINLAMRFLRWQYFLRTLGYAIPWKPSLRIYIAGFSLTTTPGKTGEALRGVFLKDYGVPFRKTFGAFLSERTSDLLSVAIISSSGLLIYPETRPIFLLVGGMITFIFFAVQKDSWIHWLETVLKRILPARWMSNVEFFLETLLSFRSCFTSKVLATTLIFGVLAWSAEAMALLYIVHLLGHDISVVEALFIYGFSLVIGGITLLPGGLGGAELTMFQLLMRQGIPSSIAVTATLVIRLTSLWFSVFLGMLTLPKDKILWKKTKSE
jgi:glycosyltransferase 2 family protein